MHVKPTNLRALQIHFLSLWATHHNQCHLPGMCQYWILLPGPNTLHLLYVVAPHVFVELPLLKPFSNLLLWTISLSTKQEQHNSFASVMLILKQYPAQYCLHKQNLIIWKGSFLHVFPCVHLHWGGQVEWVQQKYDCRGLRGCHVVLNRRGFVDL